MLMTVAYVTTDNRTLLTEVNAAYQPQRGDTVSLSVEDETVTALISHVSVNPSPDPTKLTATLNRSYEELL